MVCTLRQEMDGDQEGIRQVHQLAFGQPDEAELVEALRAGGWVRHSVVALRDAEIVGHLLFSELTIQTQSGDLPAMALAPLAVRPEHQRQGIGSALTHHGLEACRQAGERIVVVLGHPEFYRRFGFSSELARPLRSPFSGEPWMALELQAGALAGIAGAVKYPPPFGIA